MAVMTGLGVAAATLTWAAMAMLGFASLVARFEWLYTTLKLAGAAYLFWIGAKMLIGARKGTPLSPPRPSAAFGGSQDFRAGYATSITNPKAAAFFGSIFVLVLPPDCPAATQVITVIVVTMASAAWHCSLALVFSTPLVLAGYGRAKTKIDAAIGAVLIFLGVRLALSR
jgi:threonine efflux protein